VSADPARRPVPPLPPAQRKTPTAVWAVMLGAYVVWGVWDILHGDDDSGIYNVAFGVFFLVWIAVESRFPAWEERWIPPSILTLVGALLLANGVWGAARGWLGTALLGITAGFFLLCWAAALALDARRSRWASS
jgi:hypothetical protein